MAESTIVVAIKNTISNSILSPKDIKKALEKHLAGKFEVKKLKPKIGGGFNW